MRTVYQVFWSPPGIYQGGIAKILEDYFINSSSFQNKGYVLKRFNYQIPDSRIDNLPFLGTKLRNIRYMFSQRKKLIKEIQNDKECIVHIHTSRKWTFFRDLLLSRYIKKRLNISIIMTIHFAEFDKILYKNCLIRNIELNYLNKYVDRIIFLGDSIKNVFISNGLNNLKCKTLNTFHHYDLKIQPKKTYNPFRLLFMGSLDKRKGIIDLLQVMIMLSDYPDITLDICGGKVSDEINSDFQALAKQLEGRLFIHGYVSGEKKLNLLKSTNVFILPSYGEGMPVVIMEAMATGCGIIATTVGCVSEIVSNENGILIEPGNIVELKNAIHKLYENRVLLNDMEQHNFVISYKYTVSKNIEKLCSIYEEV